MAPPELIVTIDAPVLPCGAGDIGTATATISGGTPPYNFQWSDGQTGLTATGLTPGESYYITVLDANFCLVTESVTILTETSIEVQVFTTDAGLWSSNRWISICNGHPRYSALYLHLE